MTEENVNRSSFLQYFRENDRFFAFLYIDLSRKETVLGEDIPYATDQFRWEWIQCID